MNTVEIFEFEGKAFEIKSELRTAFDGTEVAYYVAFQNNEQVDVRAACDIEKLKVSIVENFETTQSESYKRGMEAAKLAKAEGRDARAAAKLATLEYVREISAGAAPAEMDNEMAAESITAAIASFANVSEPAAREVVERFVSDEVSADRRRREAVATTVWALVNKLIENNVVVFDTRDSEDGYYRLMQREDAIAQGFSEYCKPVIVDGMYSHHEELPLV